MQLAAGSYLSWPRVVLLSVAGFLYGSVYWIISSIMFPGELLDVHTLQRYGDIEYFPLITSIAKFDFSASFAPIHPADGLHAFPLFGLVWHAALWKVFGLEAFIVADLLC